MWSGKPVNVPDIIGKKISTSAILNEPERLQAYVRENLDRKCDVNRDSCCAGA